MIWIRRLVLPVLVLLGVVAAPAHATLLVRSDGNGLLIQDKNGLNDRAFMGVRLLNGQTAYRIINGNFGDIFAFDRQAGCFDQNPREVLCERNGPRMKILLLAGNDEFDMNDAPHGESSITAGAGDDRVNGHGGKDVINGGSGEDRLEGDSGADHLIGSLNADRLEGGRDADTLEGEQGADVIIAGLGVDILRGSTGNDTLNSKEPSGAGVADSIACGSGSDFLEADSRDVVPGTCEQFTQSPVGETPHIGILGRSLRVSPTGRVRVRLRCPRGVGSLGCNGSLRLAIARTRRRGGQSSRSRRVRYRIRAGRRKTVRLRLSRRDVRILRRNRRRGRRTRGRLRSLERGLRGRKTTVRNPRLRLRGR